MFIDTITALCAERGEKLTPLMKELKLSPGNVQRWRDGATVNSDILLAFSKHFGVSVDYLLTGKNWSDDTEPDDGITDYEKQLVMMFRLLPDMSQEFIYDSVKTAYEKELARQEEEKRLLG